MALSRRAIDTKLRVYSHSRECFNFTPRSKNHIVVRYSWLLPYSHAINSPAFHGTKAYPEWREFALRQSFFSRSLSWTRVLFNRGQNWDPATNEPAISDQHPPTASSNVTSSIVSYFSNHTINFPILTSVVLDCDILEQTTMLGGDGCGGCNSSPPASG